MNTDFPRRFGRYTLHARLGDGSMADTYLASVGDAVATRLCVLKMGATDHDQDRQHADRILDEAKVMMRLSCPNIATILDAGRVEVVPYIAVEFVAGRDLAYMMAVNGGRRTSVPLPIALCIAREIAKGLHYAYSESGLAIVHRDVAPANVVVSYSGDTKLIDFGIARVPGSARRTIAGNLLGHVGYLAPERLRGRPGDHPADLYAAGVILWEMLTGETLFPARRNGKEPLATTSTDVAPPSSRVADIPPDVDRILMRALAPKTADRYPNAGALWTDLADCLVRVAPSTDSRTVAAYLKDLVGDDIVEREKAKHERLLSAHLETAGAKRDEAAPPHPWIGIILGEKYRIDRLCGSGGVGDVFEGRHVGIDRKVAIKILQSNFHGQPEVIERFEREARLAARADHENIVEILDAGRAINGSPYIVMEYLEGETVEDRLKRAGPLSVTESTAIALHVACALERAHAAEIIHRDLKPGNVMIRPPSGDGEARIKVLDFGISKAINAQAQEFAELTRTSEVIGTPQYMSPEQAEGRPADARSDVYAVGGLLYEMVTARRPFDGDDAYEIVRRKASEDPVPLSELRADIPDALDKIVAKALSRDPQARQQTMAELRQELESFVQDQEAARRRARRRPKVIATAAGMAGVIAVVVVVQVLRRPAPSATPTAPAVLEPSRTQPAVPPVPKEATSDPARPPTRVIDSLPTVEPAGERPAKAQARPRPPASRTEPRLRPPAAVASPPDGPSVADLLASARRAANQGRYEAALEDAKRAAAAATMRQDRAAAHVISGDVLDVMTNYAGATREYETALAIDPTNRQAASRLDIIRKGRRGSQ